MADSNQKRIGGGKLLWILLSLLLLAAVAVVSYRPDRPVATIVPGSSSGAAFVAQIIRPRSGLPLGGIAPPQLFGLEAHLGFDSRSDGAYVGSFGPGRLELGADGWEVVLVFDSDGQVSPETQAVFVLNFEDRLRRVRCEPADPAVGTLDTSAPAESGELSGSFDIELARCEDADAGTALGWPPRPLVLHGSFDRLSPHTGAERRLGSDDMILQERTDLPTRGPAGRNHEEIQ